MKKFSSILAIVFIFLATTTTSAQAIVTGYGGDPVSCTMHANPNTIDEDGSSTLIWYTSDNVVSAQLHPKGSSSWLQDVPTEGWWWISGIADTREYTLTVKGADGQTADCDAQITVINDDAQDPTCSIHANPDTISPNGGTSLVWDSSDNVVSATLHPKNSQSWQQSVSPDGSWWISGITDSRAYSLTVETASGKTTTCDAPITVTQPVVAQAPTCTIVANPDTIAENGGTTLIWDSSANVVSAKLHPTGSSYTIANVTAGGSWWISGISNSRSYSVTVTAQDGQTATCNAPITVANPA